MWRRVRVPFASYLYVFLYAAILHIILLPLHQGINLYWNFSTAIILIIQNCTQDK